MLNLDFAILSRIARRGIIRSFARIGFFDSNPHDIEDILQNCLLQFWISKEYFDRHDVLPSNYINRIVFHCVVDFLNSLPWVYIPRRSRKKITAYPFVFNSLFCDHDTTDETENKDLTPKEEKILDNFGKLDTKKKEFVVDYLNGNTLYSLEKKFNLKNSSIIKKFNQILEELKGGKEVILAKQRHKRLTDDQKELIKNLLLSGKSMYAIAKMLKKDKNTIRLVKENM